MTAQSLLASAAAARVYDLAQPFEAGMPQSPNHARYQIALTRRHGDSMRAEGGSAAAELLVLGGHVGTHIDAFCHVSQGGLLHGGVDAAAAQVGGRFSSLGVETIAPFVGRGVLLDIATLHEVDVLEPATEITADDLEDAASRAGIVIHPGDVALVRTGWARHWTDANAFLGHASGVPGPGAAAATWLADQGIFATGGDTIAYERLAPAAGHSALPAHRILLVDRGVHIIETLTLEELARDCVYEFLFVCAPLKLVGATGSPVRPLALA